jgi:hypothetical protein
LDPKKEPIRGSFEKATFSLLFEENQPSTQMLMVPAVARDRAKRMKLFW